MLEDLFLVVSLDWSAPEYTIVNGLLYWKVFQLLYIYIYSRIRWPKRLCWRYLIWIQVTYKAFITIGDRKNCFQIFLAYCFFAFPLRDQMIIILIYIISSTFFTPAATLTAWTKLTRNPASTIDNLPRLLINFTGDKRTLKSLAVRGSTRIFIREKIRRFVIIAHATKQ